MSKTNAIRRLEAHQIDHEVIEYVSSEAEIDAISVARKIGEEEDAVFKTLVTRGDRSGIVVFVIPGPVELDLKKAAGVSGNKSVSMVKTSELFSLTGYIRGGCSPIGMKKAYPTFIDETALVFKQLFVSAGQRGMQIKIDPELLKDMCNASFANLI